MDWSSIDFDWNRARAFLVTAQEGSYSAAARALGTTQPTIGRQVTALEEELDVSLFERVGRGLQLTPTGLELLEHVRAMSEAAVRVSRVAAGHALSLDGVIVITASEAIAVHILPPVLASIRVAHPGIEIEIKASNEPADLRRREADIAIRSFQPRDPELVGKLIRTDNARLYAAPAYLATLGETPLSPAALSHAQFIGWDRTDALLKGLRALGLDITADNFPIVTSNQLVQWELVKQGSGIGIMMENIGEAEPRVELASPEVPPIPIPMWLISHRELHTSRRVRVVFDLLAAGLASTPGGAQGVDALGELGRVSG